jgi:NADH dehydrogenase
MIVGGGFGGLEVARKLAKAPVRVTVIDRKNYHLFQPLLYQVATAGLSPADITHPIRSILRKQRNTEVLMAEVVGIDLEHSAVIIKDRSISFDYLVLAPGAHYHYFGHEEWESLAPGLKSVEDALQIRRKILLAFERAEMEPVSEKQRTLLNFVIVGGGPTGVEMAGAIAELARKVLASDFRKIDPTSARIILVEAGPRILQSFPEELSEKAEQALQHLGVEVRKKSFVEQIDEEGVLISGERFSTKTVLWAAGVVASPIGKWLGGELDSAGRVKVREDLSVPAHPNIFLIGDAACVVQDEKFLPGLAPVAIQQGQYIARLIKNRVEGKEVLPPFRYFDKGQLATVGRAFAIAELGKLRLSGFIAWITWLLVHIFFLIGFRNRVLVIFEWAWAYLTFQRGARMITFEGSDDEMRMEN